MSEKINVTDILEDYTSGEATLEETNKALADADAGIYLDPNKNVLTEDNIENTTIGTYPRQANGWGLLDTGTGYMDKVEVRNGKLKNCRVGDMYALLIIAGRTYYVDDDTLCDKDPTKAAESEKLLARPVMKRVTANAGKVIRQNTKIGVYDVHYNELGYAVKATRVNF